MNILFGGDYNPEQWSQEDWGKDMEMFRAASVDTVTLNVFAWGLLQKNEEEYDFSALDETVRRHARAGHHIIMATSTSTVPGREYTCPPGISYPELVLYSRMPPCARAFSVMAI